MIFRKKIEDNLMIHSPFELLGSEVKMSVRCHLINLSKIYNTHQGDRKEKEEKRERERWRDREGKDR